MELNKEYLAGTWRHTGKNILIDLTIRPSNVSFYTEIDPTNHKVINEIRGSLEIVNQNDISILTIETNAIAEIWYIPSDTYLFLKYQSGEKREFVKIS